MKILITGTTQGIGRAIAVKFLDEGHTVHGIDRQEGSIDHLQAPELRRQTLLIQKLKKTYKALQVFDIGHYMLSLWNIC